MSGESTIAETASAVLVEGVGVNRAIWRRESALLIALVILGEALKFRSALAITIVLTSMVPFALRISPRLGLPGAPLIAAKIAGEKLPIRIRSLLKISLGYALLALAIAASILFVVLALMIMAHPGIARMKSPLSPML